jgi:hypothetical protein
MVVKGLEGLLAEPRVKCSNPAEYILWEIWLLNFNLSMVIVKSWTWEFGWENLHVEMKILPCMQECNRPPSIDRWESRLRVLTVQQLCPDIAYSACPPVKLLPAPYGLGVAPTLVQLLFLAGVFCPAASPHPAIRSSLSFLPRFFSRAPCLFT